MRAEGKEMREREISLWDFVLEILKSWRMLLIVILIGGVLAGGGSYLLSVKNVNARRAESSAEQGEGQKKRLESQLSQTQLHNVTVALMYTKLYENKVDYMRQSVLMQMDPLHVQQAELVFQIQSGDMEENRAAAKIYASRLADMALYNYVKEQCGLACDVSELIRINGVNALAWHPDMADGSDMVKVRVWHKDSACAEAMINAVADYVEQQPNKLKSIVGDHKVIVYGISLGEIASTEIADMQRSCADDIYTYQTNYYETREKFSVAELQYYNYLLAAERTEAGETGANNASIPRAGVSVRYILLGCVLFAFAYIFLIFLRCIFNNKLQDMDEMQKLFNIPQLGTITAPPQKKFLGVIDRWVMKLRYRGRRQFSHEESVELAAVSVKVAAKEQELHQISLIGCDMAGQALELCERIREALKVEDITVEILNNVLYDTEAMEKSGNTQCAVLVETAGSTFYEEITKELELLDRRNIHVLGGIVVQQE